LGAQTNIKTRSKSNSTKRPHRCRAWMVQLYAPGCSNVYPSSNTCSLDHSSPQPKRHLDRFSRFCRAHNRDRQTDRRTIGYCDVCSNRPHLRVRSTVVASFSLFIIIVGLPCRQYQQPAMERVQALADISRSALCCLSNETHAPMANLPNSA